MNPSRHSTYMTYHLYLKTRGNHYDVIKWKHCLCYWPFVRGIHRSPVNSPHKGQWHGALIFSLICAWTNGWVNNRDAGDFWDVIALFMTSLQWCIEKHTRVLQYTHSITFCERSWYFFAHCRWFVSIWRVELHIMLQWMYNHLCAISWLEKSIWLDIYRKCWWQSNI